MPSLKENYNHLVPLEEEILVLHVLDHPRCSLPLWRVHKIKRTYLASRIHGLFIT